MSDELDFRQLIGHQAVLRSLRDGDRRHPFPSLAFTGPLGVGKRLVAVWYAAFLNCHAEAVDAPCGGCGACRKILSDGHPDLHRVTVPEGKTVIGVGEAREAIHQLQYAPFEGQFRVLILENAEKLTDEAQNALLKTLEEPPDRAVLILVTPLLGALLPTVASRCRMVRFGLLTEQEVEAELRRRGAPPDQVALLSGLSRGAPGQALRLLANPEALAHRQEAIELFLALPDRDLWGASETAQRLEKLKVGGLETVLSLGVSIFRDLLMVSAGCPDLVCHQSQLAQLQHEAARLSPTRIRSFLQALNEAESHRLANVSSRIWLQRLCMRLARPQAGAL